MNSSKLKLRFDFFMGLLFKCKFYVSDFFLCGSLCLLCLTLCNFVSQSAMEKTQRTIEGDFINDYN